MAVARGRDRLKERFEKQVSEGWVKDFKEQDTTQPVAKETPKEELPELDLAGIDL